MKRRAQFWMEVLVLCAVLAGAYAQSVHRYEHIFSRNVFGLTPPQAPPTPQSYVDPPNVLVTGLTTILGSPCALLEVPGRPALPGLAATRPEYYILRKGQRQAGIQLLDVDMAKLTVLIRNGETVQLLSLNKLGPNLPGPAGPPPPPAVLPLPNWIASAA
jgi:hypothetical protein